jgi:hypothetical protein
MHVRFHRLIGAAIAAGAFSLTGCGSGGGPPNHRHAGKGGQADPVLQGPLIGARLISAKQLRLTFDGPVTVANSATAAGKFTLHGTALTYGVNPHFDSYVVSNSGAIASIADSFSTSYEIASGDALGTASAAESDSAGPNTVLLTFPKPIDSASGGDAGVLRLSYAGGGGALRDGDGNPVDSFGVPDGVPGNVGIAGPAIVHARTIDATHVEVLFTEPVETASGTTAEAAALFTLGTNRVAAVPVTIYSDFSSTVLASYANPLFLSPAQITLSDLSFPADSPNRVILEISAHHPIGSHADCRGYLRLTFANPAEALAALDGTAAVDLILSETNRGNVGDGVGTNNGACADYGD